MPQTVGFIEDRSPENMPSKHIEISPATESLLSGFIAQNPVKM